MKHIFTILVLFPFLAKAQDTTAPVISNFWTQDTVLIGVFTDFESQIPIYSITDDVDGDITSTAVVSHNVNEDSVGFYNFTLSAKDQSANLVSKNVVVQVADTTKPKLVLFGDLFIHIPFGDSLFLDSFTDQGATIDDNYWDGSDMTIAVSGTLIDVWAQGRFPISYTLTDGSGNYVTKCRNFCVGIDTVTCKLLNGNFCEDIATGFNYKKAALSPISAFPNPSKGIFSINTDFEKIEVYNSNGQLVLDSKSSDFELKAKGIYLLKLRTKEGTIKTGKLVVE